MTTKQRDRIANWAFFVGLFLYAVYLLTGSASELLLRIAVVPATVAVCGVAENYYIRKVERTRRCPS